MKVYFNLRSYESHKFTKNGSEKILLLDFINLWFAFKDRIVGSETKNGILVDENTGNEYIGDYRDVIFYCYTFARIRLDDLKKSWFNHSYIINTKMPEAKVKELI